MTRFPDRPLILGLLVPAWLFALLLYRAAALLVTPKEREEFVRSVA
ncbi:MAG TPA: hypothetical protein VGH47_03385 [Xanthobacteraceae bacterium]